jgi:hypothetical protein
MTERAQALEAAREWQIAAYGDSPETWAALAFYRERDWPVDVNTFPERERVADRISAFKAGYREALAVQPPPPVGSPTTEHEHDYVTVELCRHCLRTEADITGECHHCGEGTGARCWWCLKLKSASAQASDPPKTWIPTEGCSCYLCRAARFSPTPVSPVEPEPPAKCDVCFTAAHCHRHRRCLAECMPDDLKPTGAPAPCVWRDISTTQPAVDDIVLVYEEGHIGKALLDASGRWLDVEAGRDDAWFSVPPSHWMPFPTPPLTVER